MEELEEEMAKPDIWNDSQRAQDLARKNKKLQGLINRFKKIEEGIADLEVFIQILVEDDDHTLQEDIDDGFVELEKKIEELTIETQFKGKYDHNNAILSFHAGAGGTEAQDWVEMLIRMYSRWAEKKGFNVETLDFLSGDEAGVKSATLLIEGENAYGYLRSEKGVHRLIRISPFDTSRKRHTSFASLDVMPEIDDNIQVDIKQEDLRIDTFRAGGAGGQHVNKTDSAIRITHLPTGIVVQCQNERSQHTNKETALKMLKGKLLELKEEEHKEKIEDLAGEYNQIAWGSQIRTYTFQPYTLVKDHRTNEEVGNVQGVMDGDIDKFINAYLNMKNKGDL